MEESFVAGSFNFNIRGVDLDPDEITKNIKLKPTKVRRKDELITKNTKMMDSYWSYQVKFNGCDQLNQVLEKFLSTLLPYKAFVSDISEVYDAYIFFGLRSNLGQLGFELPPKTLQELANLNIRFEVHFISYGEVEN
ncbi:DUF4279 domain-containing protein [Bacillaceae bacterium C204]|uniref:DUF4279 domain-containing protein n=1 Tax=Neobacillus sp. 204 TaxID=3383351 RepID=UPI0039793187